MGGLGAYRFGFNGVEKVPELGEGHNTTFFREQDTRIGRWWSTDPKPSVSISPYVMMGNNPVVNKDILGDTLRAVNETSAQRSLAITRKPFEGTGFEELFQIGDDGLTYKRISVVELLAASATDKLDKDQKFLFNAFALIINEKSTNVFEILEKGEKFSQYGTKASGFINADDLVKWAGGGISEQAHYDGKIVRLGSDGSYSAVVQNGVGKSHPSAIFAHEAFGHSGIAGRFKYKNGGSAAAVIMENVVNRILGYPERPNHEFNDMDQDYSPLYPNLPDALYYGQ